MNSFNNLWQPAAVRNFLSTEGGCVERIDIIFRRDQGRLMAVSGDLDVKAHPEKGAGNIQRD
jgi:hypothetical protein